MIRRSAVLILCVFFFCGSCLAEDNRPQPRLKIAELYIIKQDGGVVPVKCELAKTDEEQSRGMMFRNEMKDGEGMLFIYENDRQMSFWMKNTTLPLSIAFISSAGRILEIRDMEPLSTISVKSGRSCRYALEAPQGWFSRAKVDIGGRLNVEELR